MDGPTVLPPPKVVIVNDLIALTPQVCRPSTVWVIYQLFTIISETAILLKTSWTGHFTFHTSAKALQHFYCCFSQPLSKSVSLLFGTPHFHTL
jgi:hypothetical protein